MMGERVFLALKAADGGIPNEDHVPFAMAGVLG
jgi:hypothetical protein